MSSALKATALVLCLFATIGCRDAGDDADADATAMTGDGAAAVDCMDGRLVESEAGPVCLYRREQALVIEGGFSCPSELHARTDTATAIACSEQGFDLLPEPVCAAIDGACDPGEDLRSAELATGRNARAGDSRPRWGGPGECVSSGTRPPCQDASDCVLSTASDPTGDENNYECVAGQCHYLGCIDDSECAQLAGPEAPEVCRADNEGIWRCRPACSERADCLLEGERGDRFDCIEGACMYVGCVSDDQCRAPGVCAARRFGILECAFPCLDANDCAHRAQEELGLDGPDPNDPFTQADLFVCRHGLCETKILGCSDEADCAAIGQSGAVCELP